MTTANGLWTTCQWWNRRWSRVPQHDAAAQERLLRAITEQLAGAGAGGTPGSDRTRPARRRRRPRSSSNERAEHRRRGRRRGGAERRSSRAQEGVVAPNSACRRCVELAVGPLDLGEAQLLARARARDLQVEVAAEHAGQRDRDHRPEADRDEAADLEGAVQHHEQRSEDAEQDVASRASSAAAPAAQDLAAASARSTACITVIITRPAAPNRSPSAPPGLERPVVRMPRPLGDRGRVIRGGRRRGSTRTRRGRPRTRPGAACGRARVSGAGQEGRGPRNLNRV